MFQGRKILVTGGGGGHFGQEAGEWAEEDGSSGCIKWHLAAAGWSCKRAMEFFFR